MYICMYRQKLEEDILQNTNDFYLFGTEMGVELARCGEKNMRGSFLLVTVLSFPVSELYESIITHAFLGGGFTHAFLNKEWSVIKCSRNFYKARMGRVYHVSQQFVKL